MRIGFLTQYYPPEIGAPQARLAELAEHFHARGHSVTVLTAMPNYPQGVVHPGYGGVYRRERVGSAEVIRTYIYPTQRADFLHRLSNYFSFVASSAAVGSVALPRLDYLLVESPPLFLGFSAMWLSLLKRTRLIFNVSDLWPESAARLGLVAENSLAYRLSARLEAWCYRRAWLVTGQSREILQSISARFPASPTFHLSNGADAQLFAPGRATEEARRLLSPEGRFTVLYAGLHGLAQGLDQLLAAAALLGDADGVDFVLVGDGPVKGALQEEAARRGLRNVRFLPAREKSEIPALVAAADAIAVPLKGHIPGAVPSKIYEAMASERPVLLIASGEAADIVGGHGAGIVAAPGDVEAIAAAVRRLRADPELRRELGRNGRRAVKEHYERSLIANRFIDHLEKNGSR